MRKIVLLAAMMIVTFFAASQKHETFLQRIKQKATSSFSGTSIQLEFQAKAIEDPESIWGNIEGLHEVTIEAACKVDNALWVVGKLENNTKLFVAKSTDSGVTWQKKDKGLPFISAQTIEKHNGRLFITVGDNEIYASDDDGENWYVLSQLPPSTFTSNWFTNVMAFNGNTLFLATWSGGTELDEIFYSNNNGQTWQSTGYQSFQTSQNAWKLFGIEYYNGKLYAFDDSMGVVIYDIATNTWIRPTNLNKPQSFYTLKIADSGTLYAGAEGGLYYSVDAAQSWQRVPTPQKNNINYVTGLIVENAQVLFTIHEEIPLLQSNGNLYTFKEGYAQTVKQLGQNIPHSATLVLTIDKNIYIPILYEEGGMLTLDIPEAKPDGSKLLLTSTNGKLFSINEYGENFEILQSDFGDYVQPVLIQKRDGSFYINNIANPGNNNNFQNQLYTISADGSQKQLIYSGYLQNINPAFYFGTAVIEGSDGNLYGVATKANTRSQFFRLTPQGQYTNLFEFPLSYNNGKVEIQSIMQASDGNFYGAMAWALDNNVNPNFSSAIFKIDASNYAFTVLKTFPRTPSNQLDVERVFGVITEGNDGYLYTTSQEGGVYKPTISSSGTIIRLKKDGTDYSVVYQFGENYNYETPDPANPIMMGEDGYIYSASGLNGGQNGFGFIYRVKTDGSNFQYLKHFSINEQVLWGGLKLLPSGRIAGALQTAFNGNGGIFTMNPDGSNYYYIKQFDAASGIVQPYSNVLIREPQQVTFPAPTPRQVGDVFELVATSSSGLPVTFTSSNPNIVSINGTTATVHAAGNVTIYAEAEGNDFTLPSYQVTQTITATAYQPKFKFFSVTAGVENPEPFGFVYSINDDGSEFTKILDLPQAASQVYFPELLQKKDGKFLLTIPGLPNGVPNSTNGSVYELSNNASAPQELLNSTNTNTTGHFINVVELSDGSIIGYRVQHSINANHYLFKYANGVYTNLHTFIDERPVERAKPVISENGFIYGVEIPRKVTTFFRGKLTTSFRDKLTSVFRGKLTTLLML
ncbi:MAG: hypothetical protein O9340_11165 [Cyclobacteriaceae bacterium]|nr:hypothetical protein [Cyclobacteriaceae bacterium]